MGLDMYLKAKQYVGGQYQHNTDVLISEQVKKLLNVPHDVIEVTFHIGDWRKANAIHKWFVDNVQDGNDDCRESYVSTEKLEQLLQTCIEVRDDHSKAATLLPTADGFFFGDKTYDDYYFACIDQTIEMIAPLLVKEKVGGRSELEYYYQSSW